MTLRRCWPTIRRRFLPPRPPAEGWRRAKVRQSIVKYPDIRRTLGNLAHEAATQQYKTDRRGLHLLYHNVLAIPRGADVREVSLRGWGNEADIGHAITRKDLSDPYLGWLVIALQTKAADRAFEGEISPAGYSRQPDLACVELHEIYEIKPNTPQQRKAGLQQLHDFRTLLQMADRDYVKTSERFPSALYPGLPEKTWYAGIQFLPSPVAVSLPGLGAVSISYSRAGAGLIVWGTEADRQEIREEATRLARDTLKVV